MRRLHCIPLVLITATIGISGCFAVENLANGDFEAIAADGQSPESWALTSAAAKSGYTLELTEDGANTGERCARLSGDVITNPRGFGNVMQTIDAKPFRGKILRFTGALRVEAADSGGAGYLWLRVDRSDGSMGFFDNMADRPIRDEKWRDYVIEGPVAADAEKIALGCMLQGRGTVWIDGMSLELVGDYDISEFDPVPPSPLDQRGLANLKAFARLYGYLRYFHPSEEAFSADWEEIARQGVVAVESAAGPDELVQRLQELFLPLAPTLGIARGETPSLHEALRSPEGKDPYMLYWEHKGLGPSKSNVYTSERKLRRLSALPETVPADPLTLELGLDIRCALPVALPTRKGKSHPRATAEAVDNLQRSIHFPNDGNDRVTRLADMIISWNIFQHFYPYFDVVAADWPAALDHGLKNAAEDEDADAFLLTLRELVSRISDGHGRVDMTGSPKLGGLPLNWAWIEDKLVVTAVHEGGEDLSPGDVVSAIDGRPTAAWVAELTPRISAATPGWLEYILTRKLAMGPLDEERTLELESAGAAKRELRLRFGETIHWRGDVESSRPEQVEEIESGIWYLDLGRLEDTELEAVLPSLAEAKGLVLDMRGYPKGPGIAILAHLADSTLTCAQWHIPLIHRPDRERMEFSFSNWPVPPRTPHIDAPCAFIIDGQAISYAETCMGIVEHYRLGAIVGSPTAGTNGNVNRIDLPGGYHISWTGMKVLKHDGSRHHGVGILPTVPVERTIAGVRAGRDELMEAALAVVRP